VTLSSHVSRDVSNLLRVIERTIGILRELRTIHLELTFRINI
jgi:hypothetical protein